uniref:Protein regulator of cytokinesis 1 n=1 Tax=Cyprinodon variegatus TaxID=28743 RepID=A0A3Q2DRL1_CYPVA
MNGALMKLQEIWDEIGIPEEQRLRRTNEAHKHVKLLGSKITQVFDFYSIQNLVFLLHVYLQEEEGCTILQMEKDCCTRVKILKEKKKQRLDELKVLVAKDRELCDIMCTTPFTIDQNSVPSVQQLQAYSSFLDERTKEKERRHDEFTNTKKEIVACMNDLEQNPEISFEMDVMCGDEEAFCLSKDNITALKLLLSQRLLKNIESCKNALSVLYSELQLPPFEVQSNPEDCCCVFCFFWNDLDESSPASALNEFDPKQQRSQKVTNSLFPDVFTEELLNVHEAEVRYLQKYYEDHKELFMGVTKWQENWDLYLELDRKTNDPSRFNNRGGNLLKEQKQRTQLQKSLPKLEEILKTQIDGWEQEHGRDFLVNGQKFLTFVQQQWQEHNEEKDREKLERVWLLFHLFIALYLKLKNVCSKQAQFKSWKIKLIFPKESMKINKNSNIFGWAANSGFPRVLKKS